jgi:ATP-binding cassette, subfamily C, bacterial LapB
MAIDRFHKGGFFTRAGKPRLRFLSWRSMPIITASAGINVLSLAMPLAILQLYDRIIPNEALETLTVLLLGVTVALVLEAVLTYVRSTTIAWTGARFEHAVGTAMFSRFIGAGRGAIAHGGNGLHSERFSSIAKIKEFYAGQALGVAADIPFVLLFVGLIYAIGGWIAAIPVGLFAGFAAVFVLRDFFLQKILLKADQAHIHQLNFVLETLGRMTTIKSVAVEAPMMRRFERLIRTSTTNDNAIALNTASSAAISASLGGVCMISVAAGGSVAVINGALSIGGLAACTLLANRALQPLQRAFGIWTSYRKLGIHKEHVREGMTLELARPDVGRVLPPIEGSIVLEGVSVRYGEDQPPVLDSIDLTVRAGEAVGIMGEAGSGKTTLLMAIAGIIQPNTGRVRIDGNKNPWIFSEASLLRRIFYIPSRGTIFAGSLLDNITMFSELNNTADRDSVGGEVERERAYQVADRLGLTALAGRLPNGFNTVIGPGSPYILPHGLVQRIAIARALFADPPVVLFDAANTALDSSGDALVRGVLEEQKGRKTLIIVSQRPSLIRIADRTFTLADGRLAPRVDEQPVSPIRRPSKAPVRQGQRKRAATA